MPNKPWSLKNPILFLKFFPHLPFPRKRILSRSLSLLWANLFTTLSLPHIGELTFLTYDHLGGFLRNAEENGATTGSRFGQKADKLFSFTTHFLRLPPATKESALGCISWDKFLSQLTDSLGKS